MEKAQSKLDAAKSKVGSSKTPKAKISAKAKMASAKDVLSIAQTGNKAAKADLAGATKIIVALDKFNTKQAAVYNREAGKLVAKITKAQSKPKKRRKRKAVKA